MADRRLHVFHTVARLSSFTKAANRLHMTQPAVTFQVKQLEEQFNTRLFDRNHNRITLTNAGSIVFDYADKILSLYDEMESSVGELTGEMRGVLLVGASTTIGEYLLPRVLGAFRMAYPAMKVRMNVANTRDIVQQVENNTIDIGIVEGAVHNSNLAIRECQPDQLVAIFPQGHALAAKERVTPGDLLDCQFVLREEGSGTREVLADYIREGGEDPNKLDIVMELGSGESVKGAVESGLGVSVVSEATVRKEAQLGTLEVRPLEPALKRSFSFVHQKQKFRSQAVERFYQFIQEQCEKGDPWGQRSSPAHDRVAL
ncbi:MAG: selenium metabolism-associated LysR family transcriptional regulator [Thiohalorhabdus sp.]|uniref:selenium metabolism-associated LysR family transcriptional regulator n=1 Tax=Thiohalorhabdus sp. TaxID=3094134 RepID=UPI003980EFD5